MKKILIEKLHKYAKLKGGKLLSLEYHNNREKLLWECKKGHQWEASWRNMQGSNSWCPECSPTKTKTLNDILAICTEHNLECLSTEYYNRSSLLKFKCLKGHYFEKSWQSLRKSPSCPICSKKRISVSDIKTFCDKTDLTILSNLNSIKKSSTYFKVKCTKGHISKTCWKSLQQGKGCPTCNKITKIPYDYIKKLVEEKGGILLTPVYKNKDSYLKIRCKKCFYEFKITYRNIRNNHWCPKCAGKVSPTHEELQEAASQVEGVCCNPLDYKNNKTKLKWKCKKGHTFFMRWNGVQGGTWCPICAGKESRAELKIKEFVDSLGLKCSKELLKNIGISTKSRMDVDLYIPEKKVAIEYNGLVWHSTRFNKDKKKAMRKFKLCQQAGIKLITIFEDEWLNKPDIIKSIIQHKLGLTENRYYARKLVIKKVDKNEECDFFNKNHIAGHTRSKIAFGLYQDNELLCCVSLRKPYTKKHKDYIEIARFASKLDSVVVGGFQKLLKEVEFWAKDNNYKGILTYADCRFGDGNVYRKSGFDTDEKIKENFYYCKKQIREGRFKHKKINDIKYINEYGKTEEAQNASRGWYRIYGCGNVTYLKHF